MKMLQSLQRLFRRRNIVLHFMVLYMGGIDHSETLQVRETLREKSEFKVKKGRSNASRESGGADNRLKYIVGTGKQFQVYRCKCRHTRYSEAMALVYILAISLNTSMYMQWPSTLKPTNTWLFRT